MPFPISLHCMPTLYRFRDITIYWLQICIFRRFYRHSLVCSPLKVFSRALGYGIWCQRSIDLVGPTVKTTLSVIIRLLVLTQYHAVCVPDSGTD